ncbi:MAG: Holliday junction resolvase RuvX [Bacteroidota bacterium]
MGRIMAIDYGSKRVGIAVTDPGRIIASGLTTVHAKDVMEFLKSYFEKEAVEIIVVGEPKGLNNKKDEVSAAADRFSKELGRKFPDKIIERLDERFTSKIASRTLIESGLKKKDRQNKALVDEISATLILQDYLERIKK